MSTPPDALPAGLAPPTDTSDGLPEGTLEDLVVPGPEPVIPKRRKQRNILFWVAVGWIAIVVFVAVFADVLPIHRYDGIIDGMPPREAPRLSIHEPLGTDVIGRSIVSRLIYGARQSLLIGLGSVTIAMSIGVAIGMTMGYLRGWVDEVGSVFLDAFLAFPPLVLLLAIAAIGARDVSTVIVGLSILGIPTFARLARANTLALADREYVQAARAMGAGHRRIIVRELLPNAIFPLSSYAFLYMAVVIVAEGSLSFLGLGVPPPKPSWGGMVNDGRQFLQTQPYLVFIPAACLLFTVLAFTIVGDRARRRFDVRESALA
jgi:peptide/nickel transport system permease protein